MGVVDYGFYKNVYMGSDADIASFPALCARASDIVGALTHWVEFEKIPPFIQLYYKKAICAQIDFLSINGMDSLNETETNGFTVGKVTVHGKSYADKAGAGKMEGNISPLAVMYLEQTGLMNPQVPCFEGWW